METVIIVSENFNKNAINSCSVCDIWLKFLSKVRFIMGQVYNADHADLLDKHDIQVREMWSAF